MARPRCVVPVLVGLLFVVSCAVGQTVVTPFKYPLFMQCDPRWAKNVMTIETICEVGCLMSSVSMALNGKNITIAGQTSNPAVLNSWLQKNGGYDAGSDDLEETVVPNINPTHISWVGFLYNNTSLSPPAIKQLLSQKVIVIANVMQGRHFVLVTGYDSGETTFYVNDPGFNVTSYPYSQIVGYRIFTFV
eukprot:TRINITY_DN940_c0_g1_i1.p1 TRINITY_DN940_c0_g1~~TRINITY_DN940_c0_g1_i1.p1  ORF type:complete len:190 (-),score=44.43 TRINITY_DN940_c0_g1_i1:193-762(-)